MQILTHLNDENNPLVAKNGAKLWFHLTYVYKYLPDEFRGKIYIQQPKKRGSGLKKPQVYKIVGMSESEIYNEGQIVLLTDEGEVITKDPGWGKRNSNLKKAQEFKSQWYDLMPDAWQRNFDRAYERCQKEIVPDGFYEFDIWIEGSYKDGEKLLRYLTDVQARTVKEAKKRAIKLAVMPVKEVEGRYYWVFKDELKCYMAGKGLELKKQPDKLKVVGLKCKELSIEQGIEYGSRDFCYLPFVLGCTRGR